MGVVCEVGKAREERSLAWYVVILRALYKWGYYY